VNPTSERKTPHPFIYFILFLPFGATGGFVSVMIGHFAHAAGMSDGVVAALVAMNTLPHTWKFLWAPVVDTVWNGRGWYVSANLISSLAIMTLGLVPIVPANADLLTAIIFINGLATTFVGMCTESLMAHLTPLSDRGRAASFSQAGNVGGSLVGGIALNIAQATHSQHIPAFVVGGALLACSGALMTMPSPPKTKSQGLKAAAREVVSDIWSILGSRAGLFAVVLCFMPIGAGAAAGLFAAMADDWHASTNVVGFSNGIGSGIGAIAGCLVGGKLSDKLDRRNAYAVSGVILAVFTFGMAVGPRTQWAYVFFVLLYNFGVGMCYSTFTAFVLEIIGKGAAATKYNIFASLANIPIYTMGVLDGRVSDQHGRTIMLWFDGGSGVVGAVFVVLAALLLLKRKPPAAPASDPGNTALPEHA
jgi:MFS transporter, PAT family, beta-lactamase induction signal transducer AmpG